MSTSAIPTFYYVVFGILEPLVTWGGIVGVLVNPENVFNQQAPWPNDKPPQGPLPTATLVTLAQLAHVCALMGTVNFFVLSAARRHLASQPAVQEAIVCALLTPLIVGDVMHLVFTSWALGDTRWDLARWNGTLWATFVIGFALMIPRVTWHLGIGRYVHKRDGMGKKVE